MDRSAHQSTCLRSIMTATTADACETAVSGRRVPYTALVVGLVVLAAAWPGGRAMLTDHLLMIAILVVILRAVTRHPGFADLIASAPTPAKWGAKIVLAFFLIGQFWGVSAQTYPAVTWTMYSHDPGEEAIVYRFDAVTADGTPVTFTPNAFNRTLPVKMGLVYLRQLSSVVYASSIGSDLDQLADAEARLEETILAYVDLYNERSPGSEPAHIEISRVAYDVTQERVSIDSGERTLLLTIEIEPS